MSLHDLPASELARIDAVCLDYESALRRGQSPTIDDLVSRYGGSNHLILRHELELVRDELESDERVRDDRVRDERVRDETSRGSRLPFGASPQDSRVGETIAAGPIPDVATKTQLPSPGTRIGPYVISHELGRGGMGVVFAAIDTRLDRRVAIKVLAIEISERRDLTERFEREARAVAAISHPNIVELFDVGVFAGLPYAVMEFLDGEPLEAILERGPHDPQVVRRIGAQIADALARAHESKVIHRDLKPQNVMLVPLSVRDSGEFDLLNPAGAGDGWGQTKQRSTELDAAIVKLFDFGLSRAPDFALSAEETGTGLVMGTPGYMSPEQVRGERVTPASDIFSLGCILYEAFYGHRAFEGRTNSARFNSTLYDEPKSNPLRRRDDVPLADLIQSCLAKDAAQRPQSAAQVARQLQTGLVNGDRRSSGQASNGTPQALTRRRLFSMTAGGVCGALAGAILARGSGSELTRIRSLAVLAFVDNSTDAVPPTHSPSPIGNRDLQRGEQLSALLVHELTRLSEVTVPRFRPVGAETPAEFRALGKLLEVDAMLTGSLREVPQGSKSFLELDLQIISSKTGTEMWGKQLQVESADNLLELSSLSTEIASVIGQRLTSTADEAAPPSVESFNCLVSGGTRADPDSTIGLEMALSCYQKAHEVDRTFAEPLAGIALTSITLAAQTDTATSVALIRQARESADEALALDPQSADARLAAAMLDWQTLGRFRQADQAFQELSMAHPNRWQVRHQHGLLFTATHRLGEAMRSLREAWQLHALSMSVKVDHARGHWYGGNESRAIQDAAWLRERYDDSILARGLLVDIFEQQGRYDLAADIDDKLDLPDDFSAADYFKARQTRLHDLPYGPFGSALNAAILQARTPTGLSDLDLADLSDPMTPMLPLLLSVHPSFSAARLLPRATEILPPNMA